MPIDTNQLLAGTAQMINAGSALAQSSLNIKTRKWNEMMYDKQRQAALADWEMANSYNSPEAQMARLKQAGLNPNLVYGNGAVAQGGEVRSTQSPSWNPKSPEMNTEGLGMMYDLQMRNAQISNLEKQREVMDQEKMLKAAQTFSTLQTGKETEFDVGMKNRLAETSYEHALEKLSNLYADTGYKTAAKHAIVSAQERAEAMQVHSLKQAVLKIANMRYHNAADKHLEKKIIQQLEIMDKDSRLRDLEIRLNKLGMTKGDEGWMRIVGNILSAAISGEDIVPE